MKETIEKKRKKNPIYKNNNKTLINDYNFIYNKFYSIDNKEEYESCYVIYNLKSIKDYFYLVYPSKEKKIKFYKYHILTLEPKIIYFMNIFTHYKNKIFL